MPRITLIAVHTSVPSVTTTRHIAVQRGHMGDVYEELPRRPDDAAAPFGGGGGQSRRASNPHLEGDEEEKEEGNE